VGSASGLSWHVVVGGATTPKLPEGDRGESDREDARARAKEGRREKGERRHRRHKDRAAALEVCV
jgi:hypothetical protein